MSTAIMRLAAAGCAIVGLAGCGSSAATPTPSAATPTPSGPPAPGTKNWTDACTAMDGVPNSLAGVTTPEGAGIAASGVIASATLLDHFGYTTLAVDARRIGTALQAGNINAAQAGFGSFFADAAQTNLTTCPSPSPT